LQQRINLGGTVVIKRADIRVPESLPASVPLLNVERPGAKPPPPAAPPLVIGLGLEITSPGQIFVRGRGLDAELAGHLHVGGTTAAPQPDGGFDLRYGTFSVVGKTLTFTTGRVGFNGSGSIDPTLDFVANNTSGNVTATLTITGTASNPKIVLSSVPEMPQDEIISRLLFSQSASSLGPFQLAQIAAALAQFSGVTGKGFDPLNSIRNGLGLDRLSVGSGGSGQDVEAGRYVAPGVYVGARQSTSGAGTQAVVQIDLAKGLKLESTVGTGGGSAQGSAQTTGDSNGTGVGIKYQFEY
jgi:translocation and assembly module TamB